MQSFPLRHVHRSEGAGQLPGKGSLFICQLANFLVCRYREHKWELNDPAKDEHHRVVRSKVKGFTDPLIITAATEIGLSAEEVLECIPDNILLFANPGEVFYRAGENAAAVPIWTGDKRVDPDLTYCSLPAFVTNPECAPTTSPASNMGAAGKPFYVGRSRESDSVYEVEDAYVQLKLEPVHQSNTDDNAVLPQSNLMMFIYTPKHHVSYTIKEFAGTRFGSHRLRPDHEAMRRIQREAAASRGIELGTHARHTICGDNMSNIRPQTLEAGDTGVDMYCSNSTTSRPSLHGSSSVRYPDTMMNDFETLKTLTGEQRGALANIIRNISMFDHTLSRLQRALTTPQHIHSQNSAQSRMNINSGSNSIMVPNLADFKFPYYSPNPTTAMSMTGRRNNGRRRLGGGGDNNMTPWFS
ncbi:unnamed protein product [Angiostrongylus costaricensis]|uniref:Anti_prolifrtn domain-containing protein n=1 Tax=Angiostrongylus costaricensis TaxID=334426 RepID=A0A158PH14_ANGCS|nr:unnamed protein product [Angiostrongylus costaricensis]